MLANCTNSSCSAPFRLLGEGKLFRLEGDPPIGSGTSNQGESFWLCHRCSSVMTLRLKSNGTVETIPLPEAFRAVPDGVSITSVQRETGLVLRSVRLSSQRQIDLPAKERLED
jgi:hypothetical protein